MAIQLKIAQQLAQSTTQAEKDKCSHSFEKEYAFGSATGDEACTKCGETRIRRYSSNR